VWDVEDSKVIEQAKDEYNIEVRKISDIMSQMMKELGTKSYRDDVLRTVQLILKMKT